MTNRDRIQRFLWALVAPAAVTVLALSGCSVDENPTTPEKMQEIRRKESNDRANFHPDLNAPKPGSTR